MESTEFASLRKATKAISISYGILRYAKNKDRDFVKKNEKHIKYSGVNFTHSKCHTVRLYRDLTYITRE